MKMNEFYANGNNFVALLELCFKVKMYNKSQLGKVKDYFRVKRLFRVVYNIVKVRTYICETSG